MFYCLSTLSGNQSCEQDSVGILIFFSPPLHCLKEPGWPVMQIRVLFFGVLKDIVGSPAETVDVPAGACLDDLLAPYLERFTRLQEMLPSLALSVNQEYSRSDHPLHEGDEVALLPPVSGGTASNHVRIVREPISTEAVLGRLKMAEDGAAVIFEGVVRNQTRGRKTLYLDYEAYEPMALKQLEQLAEDARTRFGIRDVAIVHRLGRLEIGETSVLIVVASAHRAPAFEACRWIIDTLKKTVPIWKKEYFEDGAVWADGEPFPEEIGGSAGTAGTIGASK
jgi:molybdopterin synthase catalytic subunit